MWCIHARQSTFELLSHQCGILCSEAAPLATDAGFYRAQSFSISKARRHAKFLPDIAQILFLYAQQIYPLTASHLDSRDLIFVDHIGDASQLGGVCFTSPHARNHRIGAVLLDVGMGAFVDEA